MRDLLRGMCQGCCCVCLSDCDGWRAVALDNTRAPGDARRLNESTSRARPR